MELEHFFVILGLIGLIFPTYMLALATLELGGSTNTTLVFASLAVTYFSLIMTFRYFVKKNQKETT